MLIMTDVLLLILRLLLLVLLYLFLMQVVIAITRDLRKTAAISADVAGKAPPVVGHLVVVDSGPSNVLPGTRFDLQPQTTIGRGPTNTLQLTHNFISAHPPRLFSLHEQWNFTH